MNYNTKINWEILLIFQLAYNFPVPDKTTKILNMMINILKTNIRNKLK
jgi:hypothetical protein